MKTIFCQYYFWIPNLTKMDCHQLIRYSIGQLTLIYPLLNHDINLLPLIQQLNQKPKSSINLKTWRYRQNKNRRTWYKKGLVIAPNDSPRSYNVLNEKANLITRNRRHLIQRNEKFIVKHDYDNIIKPSETTSQKSFEQTKTGIPSNITTPPVRTKSGRIIIKRHLEECWIVSQIFPKWTNCILL